MLEKYIDKNFKLFFFFLIVCFIVYFPAIDGEFLLDDEQFIQKNTFVHQLNIKSIYTTSVTEGAKMSGNFYRPNQQFIYSLIYNLFGEKSTVPFHIANILFHALNGFLLFLLLMRLQFKRAYAIIGGLLFIMHPILSESVAFISGRLSAIVSHLLVVKLSLQIFIGKF